MSAQAVRITKSLIALLWLIALVLLAVMLARMSVSVPDRQPAALAALAEQAGQGTAIRITGKPMGEEAMIADDSVEAVSAGLMVVRLNGLADNILAEVENVIEERTGSYIVFFTAPSGFLSPYRWSWGVGAPTPEMLELEKTRRPSGQFDSGQFFGGRRLLAAQNEHQAGWPSPLSIPLPVPLEWLQDHLPGDLSQFVPYISIGVYSVLGSGNPVSTLTPKGIMCRNTYPIGSFISGGEGIAYLGNLKTAPLSVFIMRNKVETGLSNRPEQPPKYFKWGDKPAPGPATAYSVDTLAPKLKKAPLIINPDGSIRIAELKDKDLKELARLYLKRNLETATWKDYQDLYNLERRLRNDYNIPAFGSPIMQNGKKVAVYMGGILNPRVIPMLQLRDAYLGGFANLMKNQASVGTMP